SSPPLPRRDLRRWSPGLGRRSPKSSRAPSRRSDREPNRSMRWPSGRGSPRPPPARRSCRSNSPGSRGANPGASSGAWAGADLGRRPLRPLRQRCEAILLRAAGTMARALPFEVASNLGAAVGLFAHRLLARRRRIAEENIARALGDPSPRALARRAFEQLGRSFLEFLALPAQSPESLLGRIVFEGFEPAFERARRGQGAIMITAHFGNWELLGAAVAVKTGRVKYLLPAQTNPWADAYLNDVRRRLGIEPLQIGFGMRSGLRALREGAFIGMLPDQDARKVGLHVPFLGRLASTHTAPARLAIRAGAPIMVALLTREGPGRFR